MITKFWNTLFDINEWVNMTEVVKGTSVIPISWLWEDRHGRASNPNQFFCINPLTQFGRKDENVTSLRNILIEFDNLPLETQLDFAQTIPFSTMTFSGNKSYHYIISLEEPCINIKEYKQLVKRIQDKLPDMDTSTSNPSRLSRAPGAIRDAGTEQKLMIVRRRIPKSDLEYWLGPGEELKTEEYNPTVAMPKREGKYRLLPMRTNIFIEKGALEGNRNRALFENACELFRANYNKEEIIEIAIRVLDLPLTEIRQCVNSAQKAVAQE